MSLPKIPLIVAFALGLRVEMTPPNPAPKKDQQLKKQAFGSWYTQRFLRIFTTIDLALAGLEIVAIVLSHPRTRSWLPYKILRNLSLPLKLDASANLYATPTSILACSMMLTGAIIRRTTYRTLGKLFTYEASILKDHHLVTSGPYAYVRHPAYTGLIIANPSWFLWHFGRGSFVNALLSAAATAGIGIGAREAAYAKVAWAAWGLSVMAGTLYLTLGRMGEEDRALRKEFGMEWDEYARRVPYAVFRGIY